MKLRRHPVHNVVSDEYENEIQSVQQQFHYSVQYLHHHMQRLFVAIFFASTKAFASTSSGISKRLAK